MVAFSREIGDDSTLTGLSLALGVLAGALMEQGASAVSAEIGFGGAARIRFCHPLRPPPPSAILSPWAATGPLSVEVFKLLAANPRLAVASVAKQLATSTRSLQRRMKDSGVDFRALARDARVALAGRALAASERGPLAALAQECGFSDSAHLTRHFRTVVGLTPSRYIQILDRSCGCLRCAAK